MKGKLIVSSEQLLAMLNYYFMHSDDVKNTIATSIENEWDAEDEKFKADSFEITIAERTKGVTVTAIETSL